MFTDIVRTCVASVRSFHTTTGKHLPRIVNPSARSNAYRACLGRPSRTKYIKQYTITLMQPDGSTVEARYHIPAYLVRLPMDLRVASEDERRQRLALRKPQVKRIKEEVIDDNFDASQYLNIFKK